MKLSYQKYLLSLKLDFPLKPHPLPTFILRSIIGKELRKLACIAGPYQECHSCLFKDTCAYSKLFETPIPPDNSVLKGRNFAPHPFIIFSQQIDRKRIDRFEMELILLGDANKYLPYFFYAIQKSGESGIFREKMPYSVEEISCDNKSLVKDEDNIIIPDTKKEWILDKDIVETQNLRLLIRFETPLRYKEDGKYRSEINYNTLLKAAYRRMQILSGLYGTMENDLIDISNVLPKEEASQLYWKDYSRFSGRQKTVMMLGGIMGYMEVEGPFSPMELSLLRAAQIFHIGKNSAFGLGRISIKSLVDL